MEVKNEKEQGKIRYAEVLFDLFHRISDRGRICSRGELFLYERGKSFDTVPAYAMRVPVDLRQHAAEKIWEEKQLPEAQTTLIYKLILPEYVEGVFFSRDFRAGDHSWPNNTNRLLPWYFKKIADLRADDYPGIPSNGKVCVAGDALLLHLKDGKCLFLKAVAGENSLSWFRVNTDGTVNVLVSTLGLDTLNGKVPFLLSSSDTSVYGTLDKAYKKLTADRRIADLSARKDKNGMNLFLIWDGVPGSIITGISMRGSWRKIFAG